MRTLFFVCLFLIGFTYIGYPLSLVVIRSFRRRTVRRALFEPPITVIVAAHNEEANLPAKLANLVATDYPADKRQIIVVSDGSTDRTNQIATSFGHGVRLIRQQPQGGKEAALTRGLQDTSTDIVVLTDADTTLNPGALRDLVANFADERVGCVTSEDRVRSDGGFSGEGLYVGYGTWLRRLESDVNSVIGLSGSLCAARTHLCNGLLDHPIDSDLKICLNALRAGYRAVNEPRALGYYREESSTAHEFRRKLRTTIRGLTAIAVHHDLLNPLRHGLTAYQIVCRKLLRWCIPFMAVLVLFCCATLVAEGLHWQVLLAAQLAFYAIGLVGHLWPAHLPRTAALAIPTYVVLCQLALMLACYQVLRGHRVHTWSPTNH